MRRDNEVYRLDGHRTEPQGIMIRSSVSTACRVGADVSLRVCCVYLCL